MVALGERIPEKMPQAEFGVKGIRDADGGAFEVMPIILVAIALAARLLSLDDHGVRHAARGGSDGGGRAASHIPY